MGRANRTPNIVIDPEFEALIPPLSDDEYQQLKQNIFENGGLRDPIVIWADPLKREQSAEDCDYTIIDGHNRWKILKELQQEHPEEGFFWNTTTEYFLETREDVKAWMIRNQLGRRNITPFARTELALKLKPIIAKQAKENQGARTDILPKSAKSDKPINTRQEIAKAAGVSGDTVAKVEKIIESAPDEVKADLRAGKVSINKVYNETREAAKEEKRANPLLAALQNAESIGKSDHAKIVENAQSKSATERKIISETAYEHLQNLYQAAQLYEFMGQPEPENDDSGCESFLVEADKIASAILYFQSQLHIPMGEIRIESKIDCFGKKRYSTRNG